MKASLLIAISQVVGGTALTVLALARVNSSATYFTITSQLEERWQSAPDADIVAAGPEAPSYSALLRERTRASEKTMRRSGELLLIALCITGAGVVQGVLALKGMKSTIHSA
jgi:hypothetical protein